MASANSDTCFRLHVRSPAIGIDANDNTIADMVSDFCFESPAQF